VLHQNSYRAADRFCFDATRAPLADGMSVNSDAETRAALLAGPHGVAADPYVAPPGPAWNLQLRPCVENSTRAIDSSKNRPNRRRCDRAREFRSSVRTTQTSGWFSHRPGRAAGTIFPCGTDACAAPEQDVAKLREAARGAT
jgi:hypothetical protein